MIQKTIWYCHPYAGSPHEGMSYRPYYLAKYWKETGHQAYVISASFHHLLHSPKQQDPSISQQKIDDVEYIRLKTFRYHNNGIKRILNMFSYAWQFIKNKKKLLEITGKPDVIIVSSSHPFHYLSLYPIAKKLQIPLIFEVRDLWPSSLIELLNLKKYHPLVIILGLIEKHAYRNADGVVSLLAEAKPYMISKGMQPQKFAYIPNGTDCSTHHEPKNLPEHLENAIMELKKQKKFLIGYAGAIGVPNAMMHFVQAMAIIQDAHPHIHAVLVGQGKQKQELINYCKQYQLHNIQFFEPLAKTQVHYFLKEMDLLYLGWQDSPLYQYGVSPNKLFDYMLAEKPILESGGASISLIENAQCGMNCPAANPAIIAKNIITMSEFSIPHNMLLGKNALNYVLQNHHYLALVNQYNTYLKNNIEI
jgi:glycosyltransferase involved in cell wall biosynthesis